MRERTTKLFGQLLAKGVSTDRLIERFLFVGLAGELLAFQLLKSRFNFPKLELVDQFRKDACHIQKSANHAFCSTERAEILTAKVLPFFTPSRVNIGSEGCPNFETDAVQGVVYEDQFLRVGTSRKAAKLFTMNDLAASGALFSRSFLPLAVGLLFFRGCKSHGPFLFSNGNEQIVTFEKVNRLPSSPFSGFLDWGWRSRFFLGLRLF